MLHISSMLPDLSPLTVFRKHDLEPLGVCMCVLGWAGEEGTGKNLDP